MNRNFSSNSQQRSHLTNKQRLPICYKDTEKVIRVVKSCKSNFKTVLANSRFRGSHFKKVYSLTLNVLKHYDYIQKIIDGLQLMEKEKMLRREIASILIYELLFGTGNLPGESKPVLTIQGYNEDIIRVNEELQNKQISTVKEFNLPRYARVHTLVTTVPYVVKDLENCGFQQVTYPEDISEEKYIELIGALEQKCFVIDMHFKDLLVFAYYENLTILELHKNGHIFLQDKSSCIPVLALNPEPGSAVIDGCAAPGMKSLHIAAKMENKGVLIACERDKSRFETLKEMLDCGAVKISKMFCKDFRLMDPEDQAFSSVDYILLDPSCSGSGMVNRMDEVTDDKESKTIDRLQKLAGFQIVLLKHALKFPSVKRVVYSTCSIHEWENEYVVHEALNAFSYTFKLVPVMPEWSERGLETYEHGKLCLRTVPEKHLTNGFFVAAFERLTDDETNDAESDYKDSNIKRRRCDDSETLSKKRLKKDRVVEEIDIDKSSRQYSHFNDCEINDMSCNYKESKIKREKYNNDSTSIKNRPNKNRNGEGKEIDESLGQHLNDSEIKNKNYDNTSTSFNKRKKKDKKLEEIDTAENSKHHLNDVCSVYQERKFKYENCEDTSTSIKKKKKKDIYCEEKCDENLGQHFNDSKISDESSEYKGNKIKNKSFDDAPVFLKNRRRRHGGKDKAETSVPHLNDGDVDDVVSKHKEDKIKHEGSIENGDSCLVYFKKEKKKHKNIEEKVIVETLGHHLNDSKNNDLSFKESKIKGDSSIENCVKASKSMKQDIKKHKKVKENDQARNHFDGDHNVEESYQFQTTIPENESKSGVTFLTHHKKKHKNKKTRSENEYQYNDQMQENVPEFSHKKSKKRQHENLDIELPQNKPLVSAKPKEKEHDINKSSKKIQELNYSPYKNDNFVESSAKKHKKKNSLGDVKYSNSTISLSEESASEKCLLKDNVNAEAKSEMNLDLGSVDDSYISPTKHKKRKKDRKHTQECVSLNEESTSEKVSLKDNVNAESEMNVDLVAVNDSYSSPTKHKKRKKDRKRSLECVDSEHVVESCLLKDRISKPEFNLGNNLNVKNKSSLTVEESVDNLEIMSKRNKKPRHSSDCYKNLSNDNSCMITGDSISERIRDDSENRKFSEKVNCENNKSVCDTENIYAKHKKRKKSKKHSWEQK